MHMDSNTKFSQNPWSYVKQTDRANMFVCNSRSYIV